MSEKLIEMVLSGMDIGETLYLNGQVVSRISEVDYEIVSYGRHRLDRDTTRVMLAE